MVWLLRSICLMLVPQQPPECDSFNCNSGLWVNVFPYVLISHSSVQAKEKARVGVRLLGHLLGGASVRGGLQTEIIEIPLSERPVAVACCSVTGDLLVGCRNTLVLITLRRQNQQNLVRRRPYIYVTCTLPLDP